MSQTVSAIFALLLGAGAIFGLVRWERKEEIASQKRLAAKLLEIDHEYAIYLDGAWERDKRWEAEDREFRKNRRRTQQAIAVLERRFQEHGTW